MTNRQKIELEVLGGLIKDIKTIYNCYVEDKIKDIKKDKTFYCNNECNFITRCNELCKHCKNLQD